MYRHSPVRNQRSKGIKTKHVVQVCLLLAVCFWLIFQLKRSHHKSKQFDHPNISRADQILKFGRKDLQPKLQETTTAIQMHQDTQEQQDEENKHEEEEQDEDKTDDGGGGGDDEIDENEQDKSNMQIDRDEVDIIDEDRETEESEEDKVTEEKDGETQTENTADHDEDGSTEHTHEAREEHYKADDASSAVITHDPGSEIKNATLDDNSSENENGGNENHTLIQEKDSESTPSMDFHENGPPPNTTTTSSNATEQGFSNNSSDESISENLETSIEDPTHLEEKEVRNDLEKLPDIETDGGNSVEAAAE